MRGVPSTILPAKRLSRRSPHVLGTSAPFDQRGVVEQRLIDGLYLGEALGLPREVQLGQGRDLPRGDPVVEGAAIGGGDDVHRDRSGLDLLVDPGRQRRRGYLR